MSTISKTDLAYAAAMLDGEGHFSITKVQGHSSKGHPYWMFDCKVGISNTSLKLMRWLIEKFGGSYRVSIKHISKKARANGQKSLKVCYRWTCEGYKKQELFILSILPYLIIKTEQAKVALEWVRMVQVKDPEKRMKLHLQMIALNQGSSPTTNTSNTVNTVKIESDLNSNIQSASLVTATA